MDSICLKLAMKLHSQPPLDNMSRYGVSCVCANVLYVALLISTTITGKCECFKRSLYSV